jgi:hypothetical protein
MINMAEFKHGYSAYINHGCRCSVCRAGNAAKARNRRAHNIQERTRNVIKLAPASPVATPAAPTATESVTAVAMVQRELDLYADRVAELPSIAAMALSLASSIDDFDCRAAKATNVRALDGLLDKIRPEKRKTKSRGRLVACQSLMGPQPDRKRVIG